MIKSLFSLLLLLLACSPKSGTNSFQDQNIPFKVELKATTIPVPENCDSDVVGGKVIYHYFIDSDGEILGINIAYLAFHDLNDNQTFRQTMPSIKVASKSSHPESIQPYYDFLLNFAKKADVIRTSDLVEKNQTYIYRLPISITD